MDKLELRGIVSSNGEKNIASSSGCEITSRMWRLLAIMSLLPIRDTVICVTQDIPHHAVAVVVVVVLVGGRVSALFFFPHYSGICLGTTTTLIWFNRLIQ